jgi:hypothetical protein
MIQLNLFMNIISQPVSWIVFQAQSPEYEVFLQRCFEPGNSTRNAGQLVFPHFDFDG